jgi:two-component system LytT family sensor kinase
MRFHGAVLGIAAWVAACLVYGSHLYLFRTLRGTATSWGHELAEAAAHFGVWALLTPLALAAARRWPLLDRRWPRQLPLHVGAALLVATLQLLLHSAVDHFWIHAGEGGMDALTRAVTGFFTRTWYANLLLWFGLVLAAGAWRRSQQARSREAELQRHLAQAQLEALRLRLHPHFLFNALNAISALIPERPAEAQRMVSRLGDVLRGVLASRAEEIPWREELALARAYLDVEQVRFQDRLTVAVETEPAIADALVPALLLQPLLENAIRHGIAQRPGAGRLTVSATACGDRLVVVVRDDGRGLGPGQGGRGVGLGSLEARLEHLYAGRASVALQPAADGGTEVRVELPLHLDAEGAAA